MPYKNIVFVKLEKRLFNDHRWYMMSEAAQLNYVRFILFAAESYNKIPKNITAIKKAFKTNQDEDTIKKTIEEIKKSFPKFKENKDFYYFQGFDEKTNYIPKEKLGKSQGSPKEGTDKEKEEDKDKDKRKKKNYSSFCKDVGTAWNDLCSKNPIISAIKGISSERQQKLKYRYATDFKDNYISALKTIPQSPFLLGRGKSQWVITFDWFIHNDTNWLKVYEGRYRSSEGQQVSKEDEILGRLK